VAWAPLGTVPKFLPVVWLRRGVRQFPQAPGKGLLLL
jgi:hypothetical protein